MLITTKKLSASPTRELDTGEMNRGGGDRGGNYHIITLGPGMVTAVVQICSVIFYALGSG